MICENSYLAQKVVAESHILVGRLQDGREDGRDSLNVEAGVSRHGELVRNVDVDLVAVHQGQGGLH